MSAIVVVGACRSPIELVGGCDAEFRSLDGPVLDVKFKEVLRVRGCGDRDLRSEIGANLAGLEGVLGRVGVIRTEPLVTVDRARLDSMYADIRARGENPPDLLSWHRLWLAPDADLGAAIAQLSARPEVEYVYQASTVNPPPP